MRTSKLGIAVAVLLVVSACSSSTSSGAANNQNPFGGGGNPTSAGGNGGVPTIPDMPAVGGGSCKVTVAGDATASWTSTQSVGSLLLSQWMNPAGKAALSIKDTDAYFILNCNGTGGSLSFLSPSNTTTTDFPEAPKSYVIPAGGLLGGADPGQISVLFSTNTKTDLWKVTEAGTFTVTTFDKGKFAGTFSFKVGKVGDDLTTITATATVSGTFDMSCVPGSNVCG